VPIGPRTKNFFVTDGQKRDYFSYLSHASLCARGATKKEASYVVVVVVAVYLSHSMIINVAKDAYMGGNCMFYVNKILC